MRGKLVILGAMAALAVAGCGGGDTTVVVQTPTGTQPAPTSTESTQTDSRGPTNALHPFETPSRNIGCQIDVNFVRCDIRDRDWPQPARPAGCPTDSDFGQGVEVNENGGGRIVCAGDTALDQNAPVLAYGESDQTGAITCNSETAGVTCKNGSGGGFFISKQSYRLF